MLGSPPLATGAGGALDRADARAAGCGVLLDGRDHDALDHATVGSAHTLLLVDLDRRAVVDDLHEWSRRPAPSTGYRPDKPAGRESRRAVARDHAAVDSVEERKAETT